MKKTRLSGYTLLEVLISIMIVGIVITVTTAGFREFSRRQNLDNAILQIQSGLRSAQSQAVSGHRPSGCVGTLVGYNFRINTSPPGFTIFAQCNSTIQVQTQNLPTGISVTTPTPNPILFLPLARGTNVSGGTQIIAYTSSNAKGLNVLQTGVITVAENVTRP